MERPLISVIMAVHNGARFLAQAIDSILTQSFHAFEFVIVDDASTDGTARIIASYRDPRIRCYRLPVNVGAAAARNVALRSSHGVFVTGMDADDCSLPDRLERQRAFLERHPSAGLVGCGSAFIDEDGSTLFCNDWGPRDVFPVNELIDRKPQFLGAGYFFRRECIDRVGAYRLGWEMNEDYDLCVRIGEQYGIGMLGGVSYRYRLHDDSTTAKKWAKATRAVILVRRLAAERRAQGSDRLSRLPERNVRKFLRKYFSYYDRHEAGSLALYYLMYARRLWLEGARAAAFQYAVRGLTANPLRRDTVSLAVQAITDRMELRRLDSIPAETPRPRALHTQVVG